MHFKYVLIVFVFAGGFLAADVQAQTLYFLNFNHGAQSPAPDPYTAGTGETIPAGISGHRLSTDSNLIDATLGAGEGGQSLSQKSGSINLREGYERQGYIFDFTEPVADMNMAISEYTIEMLIKPDLSGPSNLKTEHATLLNSRDCNSALATKGTVVLEMDQNDIDAGRIHYYPNIFDRTAGSLHSRERLKSDQWYHIAVVLRSNLSGGPQRAELWINGQLDTTSADCGGCTQNCGSICTQSYPETWETQGIFTLKSHFSIGSPFQDIYDPYSLKSPDINDVNGQNWKGEIDSVAITDDALYPNGFLLPTPPCYTWSNGDLNYDCVVDTTDFAGVVNDWLRCTNAGQTGCSTWPDPNHVIPHGTVVIDGDISEWAGATWIPIDKPGPRRPSDHQNGTISQGAPSDVSSAVMALRWEGNVVYAAVVVVDNIWVFRDSYTIPTCGDMLEVYSQGSALGGWYYAEGPSSISYQCSFAQHYVMGPNTVGGSWAGFHMQDQSKYWLYKEGDPEFDETGFQYKITTNAAEHKIIYEVAVKQFDRYGGINGEPNQVSVLYPGKVIGFDVSVGSRTTTGTLASNYKALVEALNPNSWGYSDYYSADLFQKWRLGGTDCGQGYHLPEDISGPGGLPDCVVNMYDFSKFASDWLKTVNY